MDPNNKSGQQAEDPSRSESNEARVAAPAGPDQSGQAGGSGTEVLGAPGGGEAYSNRSEEAPGESTLSVP